VNLDVLLPLAAEHKPDLSLVDPFGIRAIDWAASGLGLEGVKLLLQAGCPPPEGGVPRLIRSLKMHTSASKMSVSDQLNPSSQHVTYVHCCRCNRHISKSCS
jgi:hypothetical protein